MRGGLHGDAGLQALRYERKRDVLLLGRAPGGEGGPSYGEQLTEHLFRGCGDAVDCVRQAGRQLCDAHSLAGRPCTYRVHALPTPPASDGLAAASGLLCVGDRVVSVNGVPEGCKWRRPSLEAARHWLPRAALAA